MLMINDLLRHNRAISTQIHEATKAVIDSGWYVLGSQVKSFESEFAAYCEAGYCATVANGTDALEIALRALGIGSGDVVVNVANAGAYSTTAIFAAGARPEYVDVEDDMLVSLAGLRELLDRARVSAIIVTHLYGQAVPMREILALAAAREIPVLEDCAQAHGARVEGRRVGSLGAIACFSFYPTKNLGALGDGGAIVTSDERLARRVQALRQYGWQQKYEIGLAGGRNSRLDEMQAAVLRVKLPLLDSWNERRYAIARQYVDGIDHPAVTTPAIAPASYVGHLFVVRCADRDGLREHLKQRDIMSEVHYPVPDHRQPAFSDRLQGISLPTTERLAGEILTLPCFPEMTDHEVAAVIDAVNRWDHA